MDRIAMKKKKEKEIIIDHRFVEIVHKAFIFRISVVFTIALISSILIKCELLMQCNVNAMGYILSFCGISP